MKKKAFGLLMLLMAAASPVTTSAMDAADFGEFQQLMQMPPSVLAEKALKILDEKYTAGIDLNGCCADLGGGILLNALPTFVYTNKATEAAYRIAEKKPDILARQVCYCPEKHRNLLDCFLHDGKKDAYNEHGATNPVCYTEALLAFLFSEAGASANDIDGALRLRFDPIVSEPPPFTP